MSFEEKGAYMELLMMQFHRGHMTEDMIGQTIGQLWGRIKVKFEQDENGLWYNDRLDKEKEKRKNFTESRRNNKNGTNQYSKKSAHTTTHMNYHMENENVNTINNTVNTFGEKQLEEMIIQEMLQIWKKYNPNYQAVVEDDYPALLQLAYKIAKAKGWKKDEVVNGKLKSTLESWERIVQFIKRDSFYRKLELTTLDKKWAGLYQSMTAESESDDQKDPAKVKIKLK